MRGECDNKQATLLMSEHQSGSALENAQAVCSRLEHLWGTNLSKQGVGPGLFAPHGVLPVPRTAPAHR